MIEAKRMERIPLAGIRKMLEKATQLETQGRSVIHFEIGRPDFDTPAHIKEAAKSALDQGLVHYTPNNGLPGLRQAVAMRLQEDKKLTYDPETEIIMTGGGQEALYLSFMSVLNEGDEVLVPDPSFTPFSLAVRLAGGVPVNIALRAENNYAYDLEAARKALTSRTRAIVLNSPHNPTGNVLSREQVKAVAEFAIAHGLMVISDEAYDRMVYDGEQHHSPAGFPGMKESTIVCGSLSKTYAMTGWRVGYIAAPEQIVQAALKLQQNVLISLCTFAQHGAIAGLTGPQDCVDAMMEEFDRRRKMVIHAVRQIPGLTLPGNPRGAFYVFPKIMLPDISSAQVADYLLEHAGVAVVDGLHFGRQGAGHFRLSYAVSYDDCREGLERISAAMRSLC
jgi:aspartate aminotransferase/aminotransferase